MKSIAEFLAEELFELIYQGVLRAADAALYKFGSRTGDWLWELKTQGLRGWLREDRAAKRMRFIAWGLTLTWAPCATVLMLGPYVAWGYTWEEVCICFGPFLLPVLAAAVIPVASEAVGGVVLMLEGLFLCIGLVSDLSGPYQPSVVELAFYSSGVLPLAAGSLFLVIWWKSRRPAPPQIME